MGLPEPIEPEPENPASSPQGEDRADWLCGPEEGLEAELDRGHRASPASAPRLFRPGAESPEAPAPSIAPPPKRDDPPPVRLTLPGGGAPVEAAPSTRRGPGAVEPDAPDEKAISHGPAMLWEPGANSVPVLSRDDAPPPPVRAEGVSTVSSPLDFPMDDAEERARATAQAVAAAAEAAAAAERAAQPHAVVTPDAFDVKDALVPWWMRLPQLLREDRRVQAIAAGVLVILLAVVFWPRPEKSLSLGSIRRDAAHYDGQDVRVSGRVGEVFPIGGGYAFYLHQGRDTLVVFTRTRTPRRGDRLTLVGMVSTGYLNGQSGTALFESPSTSK